MTFISYAQNNEDALLHRALSDVNSGIYIDVGANHPSIDSVTKAFYDRGWRGINVEPIGRMVALLNQERPRDLNCQVLAGSVAGDSEFFEISDGSGLSTSNRDFAANFCHENRTELKSYSVPVATLTGLIESSGISEIHFLKIDVEGAEKDVLLGLDLTRFRPWIIVIEANLPCSKTTNYLEWEELITSHEYKFVWYDGLNRFYLSQEQIHLKEHFQTPTNFFDQVVDGRLVELRDKTLQKLAASQVNDAATSASELNKWAPVDSDGYFKQLSRTIEVLNEQLVIAHQRAIVAESRLAESEHLILQKASNNEFGPTEDLPQSDKEVAIEKGQDNVYAMPIFFNLNLSEAAAPCPLSESVLENGMNIETESKSAHVRNRLSIRQELDRFWSRQYRSVRKRLGVHSIW